MREWRADYASIRVQAVLAVLKERAVTRIAALILLAYLASIALAEILASAVNAQLGLPLHALILIVLLWHGAMASDNAARSLWWAVALVPLMRVVSLSLPLASIPMLYWFAAAGVPLLAAVAIAARALGYSRRELGLTVQLSSPLLIVFLILFGLVLGVAQYAVLQQPPLFGSLSSNEVWIAALILTFSAGVEELVFRGLLQRAALQYLGHAGLVYVTILSVVMAIGYLSLPVLFLVFCAGLFFAVVALWTGSIFEVTLAHASVNLSLFLIAPLLLPWR